MAAQIAADLIDFIEAPLVFRGVNSSIQGGGGAQAHSQYFALDHELSAIGV
jgi:hypothetical protein